MVGDASLASPNDQKDIKRAIQLRCNEVIDACGQPLKW